MIVYLRMGKKVFKVLKLDEDRLRSFKRKILIIQFNPWLGIFDYLKITLSQSLKIRPQVIKIFSITI